jgi:3-oxoacyl-[acyl-carrier-protein] synthase-3
MKCGNFGFQEMVYEMPTNLVDVSKLVMDAGFNNEMVARLHNGGLQRVPVSDGRPLPILVRAAINKLLEAMPNLPEKTCGILFAHSVPLLAPANIPFLSLCLEDYKFDNIPRVAVSGQPCAILHMAVQLAGNWLNDFSAEKGILLIGADQAYSVQERIFFGSAMGDVAVAMFVSQEANHNQVLATISECEVIATGGEASLSEDIARFRSLNPLYIRHAIEKCLMDGEIELGDLTCIVPHTPYTMIWDTIAELLKFPRQKILTDYLSETGHLNSNDSFVHYQRATREGRINDGDLALLVNPGFGGTRGCTLIRR